MRKFNTNQVCRIRHAVNIENTPATVVAKRYNASPSAVRRVAAGKSYSDIPLATAIPGYSSYLAYPDGRIWSTNRNRFIKAIRKGDSKTRYYNLTSNGQRTSIRADEVSNRFF